MKSFFGFLRTDLRAEGKRPIKSEIIAEKEELAEEEGDEESRGRKEKKVYAYPAFPYGVKQSL